MVDLLSSNPGEYTRLARRSIQQNYLDRCLNGITVMFSCLANLEGNNEVNAPYIARLYINCILDDTIRRTLLTEYDKKMKEIHDKNGALNDRLYANRLLAIDMIGEVNAYFDEYFSVHSGQKIGDV